MAVPIIGLFVAASVALALALLAAAVVLPVAVVRSLVSTARILIEVRRERRDWARAVARNRWRALWGRHDS